MQHKYGNQLKNVTSCPQHQQDLRVSSLTLHNPSCSSKTARLNSSFMDPPNKSRSFLLACRTNSANRVKDCNGRENKNLKLHEQLVYPFFKYLKWTKLIKYRNTEKKKACRQHCTSVMLWLVKALVSKKSIP